MFMALVITLSIPAAGIADEQELVITVKGLTTTSGTLHLVIFNSADSWKKDWRHAVKAMRGKPAGSSVTFVVKDLPAGWYGVKCFHDVNGNNRMEKNFVGYPTEPFGFSNDFVPRTGPPSFEKTRFRYNGGRQHIEINLQ